MSGNPPELSDLRDEDCGACPADGYGSARSGNRSEIDANETEMSSPVCESRRRQTDSASEGVAMAVVV